MSLPVHPSLSVLVSFALFALPSPTAAAGGGPVIVPGLSRVTTTSQIGTPLVTVSDVDSQTGTLGSLSANVAQSGAGAASTLSHDLAAAAVFASAASGTVDLHYVRSDTKLFGTSAIFGGVSEFRYEFVVSAATTVSVDYDVIGTESNPGNSWFAMQGFDVEINGQKQSVNFSLMFLLPPKPFSPQDFQGTFTFAIPAGSHALVLRDAASASGNQWDGVRTMVGRLGWRIGEPVALADLGQALPGTHGAPLLEGTGSLVGGSPFHLELSNALEDATASLIVGFNQIFAPFKGGVMVPDVDLLLASLPTGPAGAIELNTTWPLGLPSGFTLTFQFWLADPAGPFGFAASNGVAATVP